VNVPFSIDKKAGISAEREHKIKSGLKRIEKRTCIRFKPRGNEKNFIEFTSLPGENFENFNGVLKIKFCVDQW
jgi:hypothetical protein